MAQGKGRSAASGPAGAKGRIPLGVPLALLFFTLLTWFSGWPRGLAPVVPTLALLVATAVRFGPTLVLSLRNGRWRPFPETALCLALAVAYRWPALLRPWGFVNKDGAFPAAIALHLLAGVRPAPVFTEGANYQGSLKGHIGALLALVTGSRDLSWLILLASVLLYLLFLGASMALARRIAGRGAALVTGLYLALSPKFLTTFSLNSVGQYVDVLALGGASLVLVAGLLDRDLADRTEKGPAPSKASARLRLSCFGIGYLLGAAFWQQPVALAYVGAALGALALRRALWRDPALLLVPLGLVLGALPVLVWNVQNGWGSGDILGRYPQELLAQAEVLPVLVARTATRAFPVLTGLSPGHPMAPWAGARALAAALLPLVTLAYLVTERRSVREALRGRSGAVLLPPLLAAVNLAIFWATASGSINKRPRYLLPLLAAFAVMLGVVAARGWARSRLATAAPLLAILALNATGSLPRLRESASIEAFWQGAVQALEQKGIRTGYSDFSVAAPITMFTAERITLSSRLGPTPAYYSERQDERVAREGPDAYILSRGDDPAAFAAALRDLGVTCRYEPRPFPTFWDCSRRVRLAEVIGFRGGALPDGVDEE